MVSGSVGPSSKVPDGIDSSTVFRSASVRDGREAKSIIAVDCDLDDMYLVRENGRSLPRVHGRDAGPLLDQAQGIELILFEIASPVYYRAGSTAAAHHTTRWMLRNMATAAQLAAARPRSLLVSPSSAWSCGHGDKARWELSEAKQKNKHERDAWSMLWFYWHMPQKWQFFDEYLAAL